MIALRKTILTSLLLSFASVGWCRNDILSFPVNEAMYKQKLGDEIKFYFGNQAHGKVIKSLGTFKTNKKTNAFNKSDKDACDWAMLSAMITLKERAKKEGGNAVINIHSNYKDIETVSDTSYQCGAGTMVAGVALTGEVVQLEAGAEPEAKAPAKK